MVGSAEVGSVSVPESSANGFHQFAGFKVSRSNSKDA